MTEGGEMDGPFSMRGRYDRTRYFWTVFLVSCLPGFVAKFVDVLLGVAAKATSGEASTTGAISLLAGFSVAIAGGVVSAFAIVKRFHDLDRPGRAYWLLLVPFYNIYLMFVLLFRRGTAGANRYGPDPLAYKSSHERPPVES
jgi:uncharacterized membrane protein YhaH (DUF805 family)